MDGSKDTLAWSRRLPPALLVGAVATAALALPAAPSAAQDEESGSLTVGKPEVGSLVDTVGRWSFTAEAGQSIVVTAESDVFDTVLELRSPAGALLAENDDCLSGSTDSCLETTIPATGRYQIRVTAYRDGIGIYTVAVQEASVTPLTINTATLGRLGEDGVGRWSFAADAGQSIVVTAESDVFDTVLELRSSVGALLAENDDCAFGSTDSCLETTIPATGRYQIRVIAYGDSDSGIYEVAVHIPTDEDPVEPSDGALERGDRAYATGEHYDGYTVEVGPGETLAVEVQSDAFKTYLVVVSPSGERIGRAGAMQDGLSRALLEVDRAEPGVWQVNVTSASPAETGLYRLRLDARAAGPTLVHGRLEAGDAEGRNGEYVDIHLFEADDLDCVAVRLTGAAGLRVRILGPDGYHAESTAVSAAGGAAVLDEVLSGGPHRAVVIGAADRTAAEYTLEIGVGCSATGRPQTTAGRTHGIFIGVSDYGDRADDLPRTADDAGRFAAALVDAGLLAADNAIVLTDREATVEGMKRAVAELGSRIEPEDTFVLFFSGHGDRVPRAGAERADPDGYDETIELFDGALLDNELDELLKQIRADLTLVVLDSCFSGGFAKDVIAEPGRMGLFSSEEDTESRVPNAAGGYLSLFLTDAVTGRRADTDGDGAIRAVELRRYLYGRFRIDVPGGSDYQHLQVDPGDVDLNDIVFRLQATA